VGDLIGPQLSLNGKLSADLNAAGTLGQPRLSGAINGDNLALTEFDQGIQLKDGIVRIVMDSNVIELRQIEFQGGRGTLRAGGKIQLGNDNPDLNATLTADHLEFASPDRQLMLSGEGKISNVNEQLRVDGKFIVDRACSTCPRAAHPSWGTTWSSSVAAARTVSVRPPRRNRSWKPRPKSRPASSHPSSTWRSTWAMTSASAAVAPTCFCAAT
jgi:translocation and assembly module TamB